MPHELQGTTKKARRHGPLPSGNVTKKIALPPDLWAFAKEHGKGWYTRGVEKALREAKERALGEEDNG